MAAIWVCMCENLHLPVMSSEVIFTEQAVLKRLSKKEIQDDIQRITSPVPAEDKEDNSGANKARHPERGQEKEGPLHKVPGNM